MSAFSLPASFAFFRSVLKKRWIKSNEVRISVLLRNAGGIENCSLFLRISVSSGASLYDDKLVIMSELKFRGSVIFLVRLESFFS